MSRKEKLIARFRTQPRDFTWDELVRLLRYLGYEEITAGKTSGSRCRFEDESGHPIYLHKPHPGNIVKKYVIDDLTEELKQERKI
jgi:hypothetical protein